MCPRPNRPLRLQNYLLHLLLWFLRLPLHGQLKNLTGKTLHPFLPLFIIRGRRGYWTTLSSV